MSNGKKVVVSLMRDEGPYVPEWLAHQHVLGFDEVVVVTNDCTDGTVEMLDRFQEMGLARRLGNTAGRSNLAGGGIQRTALRMAKNLDLVQEADWVFHCDSDEFLNIHVGAGRVDDLIAAAGTDADVISVAWRIFGNAGILRIRDALTMDQFFRAEPATPPDGGSRFAKSLFRRASEFRRLGPHVPHPPEETRDDFRYVNPRGAAVTPGGKLTGDLCYDVAQVNHYALRSIFSYMNKCARGRANHMSHTLGIEYWRRWNLNEEEDRSILRYRDEVAALVAQWREDPVIDATWRRALRIHRRRAKAFISAPETRPTYSRVVRDSRRRMADWAGEAAPDDQMEPDEPVDEIETRVQ